MGIIIILIMIILIMSLIYKMIDNYYNCKTDLNKEINIKLFDE